MLKRIFRNLIRYIPYFQFSGQFEIHHFRTVLHLPGNIIPKQFLGGENQPFLLKITSLLLRTFGESGRKNMILANLRIRNVIVIKRNRVGGSYSNIKGDIHVIWLSSDIYHIPAMILHNPRGIFGLTEYNDAPDIYGIQQNFCRLRNAFTLCFLMGEYADNIMSGYKPGNVFRIRSAIVIRNVAAHIIMYFTDFLQITSFGQFQVIYDFVRSVLDLLIVCRNVLLRKKVLRHNSIISICIPGKVDHRLVQKIQKGIIVHKCLNNPGIRLNDLFFGCRDRYNVFMCHASLVYLPVYLFFIIREFPVIETIYYQNWFTPCSLLPVLFVIIISQGFF